MPNKRRMVSLHDYAPCYQYFHRAIQNNRFMIDGEDSTLRAEAIQAFYKLEVNALDNASVHILQLWLDNFIDSTTWGRCYRSLNQKKYLVDNNHRTITISEEAHNALKNVVNEKNISLSQVIIDGCAFIKNNCDNAAQSENKPLKSDTLVQLYDNPLQINSSSKIITPINQKRNNVVSLFGDETHEILGEESEPEFDSFYFNEVPEWPRKPEGYDFRANESYKEYRKHIECLTIKKPDKELLNYFNKTIDYYLTEDNCHQIGSQLLTIREVLLEKKLLSREFNADLFALSKGFNAANLTIDDYGDELIYFLSLIFGCATGFITSGNRELLVFIGHPNHVQIAYTRL